MQKEKNSIFTSYVTIEKSPGVFPLSKNIPEILTEIWTSSIWSHRQTPVHNMKNSHPFLSKKQKQTIMIFILKVLSGEMYPAHSTGLETSRRCFRKNRPSHNRARALQLKGAISYSNEAVNEQMRSKAHSALTVPLVLHHTRIYKCAMKQKSFSIDGINIFFNGLLSFFPGRYECCAPL